MDEVLLTPSVLAEIEALRGCSEREAKLRDRLPWESVRFDPHKWAESAELDSIIDGFVTSSSPTKGLKGDRLHRHFKVVVLNLLSCFRNYGGWYVAYHRGQHHYKPTSRYNGLKLRRDYIVKAVDTLIELDFVDHNIGFYDRKSVGRSRISRMRAKIELLRLLDPCDDIKIFSHPDRECIVKRDASGRDVEYGRTASKKKDSPLDMGMRKRLHKVNELLAGAHIELEMTDAQLMDLNYELWKSDQQVINFEKTFLRRVFNVSFKRGGRFYNGWWQNVPSSLRPKIIINGEPTVELDYTAIHPSIAYLEETGELPSGDPYSLSAYDGDPTMRKLIKSVFLILLNAKTRTEAKRSLRKEIPRSSKLTDEAKDAFKQLSLDEVFENIKADHPAIWKYMGQGLGTHLQYYDSCVADDVLTTLVDKGIVTLPVHDSFIVQARHEKTLRNVMEKVFVDQWGSCPKIG